jgi:ribonuclease P protein component
MLPRHLRLKRPEDFQAVKQRGSRWRDPLLTVNAVKNDLPHNRYGFVVSKRVGSAVVRNQVKRRLRAAIARWHPLLPIGYDCVLIVQPPASGASYQTLEHVIENGLRHLRLLAAPQ